MFGFVFIGCCRLCCLSLAGVVFVMQWPFVCLPVALAHSSLPHRIVEAHRAPQSPVVALKLLQHGRSRAIAVFLACSCGHQVCSHARQIDWRIWLSIMVFGIINIIRIKSGQRFCFAFVLLPRARRCLFALLVVAAAASTIAAHSGSVADTCSLCSSAVSRLTSNGDSVLLNHRRISCWRRSPTNGLTFSLLLRWHAQAAAWRLRSGACSLS